MVSAMLIIREVRLNSEDNSIPCMIDNNIVEDYIPSQKRHLGHRFSVS